MNSKNPIRVTEDLIRVPKEFLKLNKYVLLTMDIFFVNNIPFLITLIRNIDFTATSNFPTKNLETYSNPFGASISSIKNVV